MTKEDLKRDHPELYAEILTEGVAACLEATKNSDNSPSPNQKQIAEATRKVIETRLQGGVTVKSENLKEFENSVNTIFEAMRGPKK